MALIVTNKAFGSTRKGFRFLWKSIITAVQFTYLQRQSKVHIMTMMDTGNTKMAEHSETKTFPSCANKRRFYLYKHCNPLCDL
jgi:hypothetical protein